jgi:hypothetical protein
MYQIIAKYFYWRGSVEGQIAGCCEDGHEPLGYIKCRTLLETLGRLLHSQKRLYPLALVS